MDRNIELFSETPFWGAPLTPFVRLLVLRILVTAGGYSRSLVDKTGFRDDSLALSLGFEPELVLDTGHGDFPFGEVRKRVAEWYREAEEAADVTPWPEPLGANLSRLGRLLGLEETDRRILGFVVLLNEDPAIQACSFNLGSLTIPDTLSFLSLVLGLEEKAVSRALSMSGHLIRSGLIEVDPEPTQVPYKLHLSNKVLLKMAHEPFENANAFLRDLIRQPPPPELGIANYPHLKYPLELMTKYLADCLDTGREGVNVLLYGPPGTGKTQLARLLGQAVGAVVYEISPEDEDGYENGGHDRLRNLATAQHLIGDRRALLVFDELEDALAAEDRFSEQPFLKTHKGWFNRFLETVSLPVVWLSNSISSLDAAALRRFDMVLEVVPPPASYKKRLLDELSSAWLPEEQRSSISQIDSLTPAVIARAARVVGSVSDGLSPECREQATGLLIDATLKAQGHAPSGHRAARRRNEIYDLSVVNTDLDLEGLARSLTGLPRARLCLYGPPGTGKTAYAFWLAERLDRSILVRRASELLSPWLGETEKRINAAFETALDNDAVLLIDEADSFLRERRHARASWEVTQVNEMLVRMEEFDGIFVASTNLIDDLDRAALRRFDFKILFDYPTAGQAWRLFRRYCESLELGTPDPALRASLASLNTLAPGDFAVAARRHRVTPLGSPEEFLEVLRSECALKAPRRRPIGFLWD